MSFLGFGWDDTMELEEKLPDEFSRLVLEGSQRVLADAKNPIRLTLFAAGLRELFGHVLDSFAPQDEVRTCSWFQQALDTASTTRRQRATYATQGGLSDSFVAELGVDVADLHSEAIKSIEALNKATHVRPNRLEQDQKIIEGFARQTLAALDGLLESSRTCRTAVSKALEKDVYEGIMTAFVTETFEKIEFFAGKGYQLDQFLEDEEIFIEDITARLVQLKFSGVVPVTLHYSSSNDMTEISHDFPFWMRFTAPIEEPTNLSLVDHFIDDSGWYE